MTCSPLRLPGYAGLPSFSLRTVTALSDTQAELIATNFARAIVMLDGDDAGVEALLEVVTRLGQAIDVRIVKVPTGRQPDTL